MTHISASPAGLSRGSVFFAKAGLPDQAGQARNDGVYDAVVLETVDICVGGGFPKRWKLPVILIDPAEQAAWLQGGDASLKLQRPLSDEQLKIRP